MGFDSGPGGEGDRAQRLAPVVGQRLRHQHLAADLVQHQVQQLVLVGDVGVKAHRPDPELLGQAAHRDRFQALGVGHPHRRVDDLLAARTGLFGGHDVHASYTVR